jgi:FKBP12-rapamycin complex-associated protein
LVLSGEPYRAPGAPDYWNAAQMNSALRELQITDAKDPAMILLALRILGTFDFSGML